MRVGIFGAGAIGGYLGVCLSAAGVTTIMVGRSALVALQSNLAAVTLTGRRLEPAASLVVSETAGALADVDLCLVTVKARDTREAARELAKVLAPRALVVSLQNGLSGASLLGAELGRERTLAGVVVFNVAREGATFRKTTKGDVFVGSGCDRARAQLSSLARPLRSIGEVLSLRDDIKAVQRAKLLLNLNNGVCAATGLGIFASIESEDARWCFAACLREGLAVLEAHRLAAAQITHVPLPWIARALLLPSPLIRLAAASLVGSDSNARSSTLVDLESGKATEIEQLNGAIVALGAECGVATPANAAITELVHGLEAEAARGTALSFIAPRALRRRISLASS